MDEAFPLSPASDGFLSGQGHHRSRARLTHERTAATDADPRLDLAFIDAQVARSPVSYDDLRAVVFNGTTKLSPEPSHTDGLLAIPLRIFSALGVRCEEVRTVDRTIPPGLWPALHGSLVADSRLMRATRHWPPLLRHRPATFHSFGCWNDRHDWLTRA